MSRRFHNIFISIFLCLSHWPLLSFLPFLALLYRVTIPCLFFSLSCLHIIPFISLHSVFFSFIVLMLSNSVSFHHFSPFCCFIIPRLSFPLSHLCIICFVLLPSQFFFSSVVFMPSNSISFLLFLALLYTLSLIVLFLVFPLSISSNSLHFISCQSSVHPFLLLRHDLGSW